MTPSSRPARATALARDTAAITRKKWLLLSLLPVAGLFAWAAANAAHAETRQPAGVTVAAASGQQQAFDIPSGKLADALTTFSTQTQVQVSYDQKKVNGLTTPGLKGTYPIQAGLDKLLEGTGYVSEKQGAGYALVAAPPAAAMTTAPALASR